jgi:hypothetical protein
LGIEQLSDIPTKVFGSIGEHLPFGIGSAVTKAKDAMNGGGGDQQQQVDPKIQRLIDSGFGTDAGDVQRRSDVYGNLLNSGIDNDIAFDVAYGDSTIGQKVAGARNTSSPLGNLDQWSAQIQARTQPYADQMRASAADYKNHLSGDSKFLNATAPATVDLTNANAAALQASAAQYPYLLDMQNRGDVLDSYYKSLYNPLNNNQSGGGLGDTLTSLGIKPEDLAKAMGQ